MIKRCLIFLLLISFINSSIAFEMAQLPLANRFNYGGYRLTEVQITHGVPTIYGVQDRLREIFTPVLQSHVRSTTSPTATGGPDMITADLYAKSFSPSPSPMVTWTTQGNVQTAEIKNGTDPTRIPVISQSPSPSFSITPSGSFTASPSPTTTKLPEVPVAPKDMKYGVVIGIPTIVVVGLAVAGFVTYWWKRKHGRARGPDPEAGRLLVPIVVAAEPAAAAPAAAPAAAVPGGALGARAGDEVSLSYSSSSEGGHEPNSPTIVGAVCADPPVVPVERH